MKWCGRCKKDLPVKSFTKDSSKPDGLKIRCRECSGLCYKEWADKNPHKIKAKNDKNTKKRQEKYSSPNGRLKYKDMELRRTFGISLEDYHVMLQAQNGVCDICKKENPSKKDKYFSVDHNHKTDQVRGLLCLHCNRGIGCFFENVQIMLNAIEYIRKYNEN